MSKLNPDNERVRQSYFEYLREAKRWANLLDAIYKLAVCKVLEGQYLPQSGSISADGLSQSLSVDTSKYRELVDSSLAGLRTRIQGITMATLGVLA